MRKLEEDIFFRWPASISEQFIAMTIEATISVLHTLQRHPRTKICWHRHRFRVNKTDGGLGVQRDDLIPTAMGRKGQVPEFDLSVDFEW